MTCTWCLTDSIEAAKHHAGPHATWCPRYSLTWKYATPTSSVDAAPTPQIPPTDLPAE